MFSSVITSVRSWVHSYMLVFFILSAKNKRSDPRSLIRDASYWKAI